jgi:hypothetical protein
MEIQKLNQLLNTSLEALKKELNLPPGNPRAVCYRLTEEMFDQVQDADFKQVLERFVASTGIPNPERDGTLLYPHDLQRLTETVGGDFPELWKELEGKITATESREHLSALSLTAGKIPGQTYIALASTRGDSLTLESWKFTLLLEQHEKPRKLADLKEVRRRDSDSLFAFNRHEQGEVLAQFDARESTLRVICRNTEKDAIDGRADFLVDIDYLLCLYIALKRLREDHERFTRLKEEADATVDPDVFEQLYHYHS